MSRLAHGWRLAAAADVSPLVIREFIRPAVRAIPSAMARRIGPCEISVAADLGGPDVASRWTAAPDEVNISVAGGNRTEHDVAMELLVCLGQVLWAKLSASHMTAYWRLLDREFLAGVAGEIDEDAAHEKQKLLQSRFSSRSTLRLEEYGRASFAATAGEYVHCLWHDVRVRSGREHLPAEYLERRLRLIARWFPPDRGYRLFGSAGKL